MKFPLAGNYFGSLEMSSADEAYFVEMGKAGIQFSSSLDCSYWSPLQIRKGPMLQEEKLGTRGYSVRTSSVVEERFDTIVKFLKVNGTKDFRVCMRQLCPKLFLDGLVLYQSKRYNSKVESFGVKWAAFEMDGIGKGLDMCVLDYSCMHFDDGLKKFTRVMESIPIPPCHEMHSHGLTRMHLNRCVYTVEELKDGNAKIHFACSMQMGHLPSMERKQTRRLMQKWAISFGNIQQVIRNNMLTEKIINRNVWPQDDQSLNCAVCQRVFNVFRWKHHCKSCGKAICKKCGPYRKLALPIVGLRKIRICYPCTLPGRQNFALAAHVPPTSQAPDKALLEIKSTSSLILSTKSIKSIPESLCSTFSMEMNKCRLNALCKIIRGIFQMPIGVILLRNQAANEQNYKLYGLGSKIDLSYHLVHINVKNRTPDLCPGYGFQHQTWVPVFDAKSNVVGFAGALDLQRHKQPNSNKMTLLQQIASEITPIVSDTTRLISNQISHIMDDYTLPSSGKTVIENLILKSFKTWIEVQHNIKI